MSSKWTTERAQREKPPLLHPLAGANLKTFVRKWVRNRPFDRRSRLPRLLAMGAVAVRVPFDTWRRLRFDRKLFRQSVEKGPVFIVGHWRSGTTHLHNLMSQDPQFGWISFIQTVLPWDLTASPRVPIARKLIERELPEKRGTDNVAMHVDSPQEEEWAIGNLNELSFFNSYYFPQRYLYHYRRGVLWEGTTEKERAAQKKAYERLVKALHFVHGGRQILFKNPSATARLPMLKEIFPNARFVHIVRNPFAVYASSLARHPRLMNAFSWQKFDDIDFESICFECYETLMRRYLEDRDKIPPEDLVEVRFEDLIEDPLREIGRIYDSLSLPDKEVAFDRIRSYLESLGDYQKNVHHLTRHQVETIESNWGFALERWGYGRPEIEIVE